MGGAETSIGGHWGGEKIPVETERKFQVVGVPEGLAQMPYRKIRQGYMVLGADGSESRLRDDDGLHFLTIKSGGDLSRREWETVITSDQFDTLWPSTEGRRVEKIRYEIPHGDRVVELDVYGGHLEGLVTAEVEFGSEAEAMAFEPPDWLGADITANKAYKNQNLALGGRPE
jgi:adenylate cyclase